MKKLLSMIIVFGLLSCDNPDPEPQLVRCDKSQGPVGVVCNDGFEWTHGNSSRTCDPHGGVNYYLCPE
jgi:hypothetical protein